VASRASQQTAGLALAILALAVSVAVLLPKLLGVAAGPDAEVVSVLKASESQNLALQVPGADQPLISSKHHYDRITVAPEGPDRQVATATLDFTGSLGPARVSSLGLERVVFQLKDQEWTPMQGVAPRLVAAVSLLERRRSAIARGQPGELEELGVPGDAGAFSATAGGSWGQVWDLKDRRFEVKAWLLRFERGEAEVREEYRLVGTLPSRPVDEPGARSLRLRESPNGQFLFVGDVL